jgi:hypothetical protein
MNSSPGRAPDRVVKDVITREGSAYTSSERLVALAIADHLNAEGVAWPSFARLTQWTGLKDSAIKVAVRSLCCGPLAIFERQMTTGRGSCTYRLREDVGEGSRQATPSFNDPVVYRRGGGRQTPPTGSLNAAGTPNRTPHGTPEHTPPTPRSAARGAALERAVGTGKLLVVLQELETYQIHLGGSAEKGWRKWAREGLRSQGLKRGAQLVRERIERDAAQREADAAAAASATASALADAASERAKVAHAREHGRPVGAEWARLLTAVEARLNPHSFGTWFRPLSPIGIVSTADGERLFVGIPHAGYRTYLRGHHETIDAALREVGLDHLGLELVVDEGESPPHASRAG